MTHRIADREMHHFHAPRFICTTSAERFRRARRRQNYECIFQRHAAGWRCVSRFQAKRGNRRESPRSTDGLRHRALRIAKLPNSAERHIRNDAIDFSNAGFLYGANGENPLSRIESAGRTKNNRAAWASRGTPKRPLRYAIARATSRTLLLRHGSAGHTTTRRLHADRGWPERSYLPELPGAAGGTRRADEGAWAGVADRGAVVDRNARGKATTRDL